MKHVKTGIIVLLLALIIPLVGFIPSLNITSSGHNHLSGEPIIPQAHATVSRVQTASGGRRGVDTGTTYTITLGSNPTDGDALYILTATGGGTVASISETGATYSQVKISTSGTLNTELWQALNIAGASKTITITLSGQLGSVGICAEYSGIVTSSATDQTAAGAGSSSTAGTGTTATTTQAFELWLGAIGDSARTQSGASNGFTQVLVASNSNNALYVGLYEKVVSSTGTAIVQCTLSASDLYAGVIGTFKAIQPAAITWQTSAMSGTGTVLIIDSTPYTYAQLPVTLNWTPGSTHAIAASTPVAGGAGKQYLFVSYTSTSLGTQSSSSFTYTTPASAETVTENVKTQWQISFTSSGIGSDTGTSTIVTVGGVGKSQADLSFTAWYDDSSAVNYAYSSPVSGSINTYTWSSTSGCSQSVQSGTVTASSSCTVIGTYTSTGQQHAITFTSSGIGSDTTGTVVVVAGNSETQASLPYTALYADGSSLTYSFSPTTASTTTGKQYAWASTSGLGQTLQTNTFTVRADGTVTGTFATQYQLTITLNSHGQSSPPSGNWYDSGTVVQVAIQSDQSSNSSTTRYIISSIGGSDSGYTGTGNPFSVTMSAPITETVTWQAQYDLTFATSGIGSDTSTTVLTINSVDYVQSQLPASAWYNAGLSIMYTFVSPLSTTSLSKRYIISSVAGLSQTRAGEHLHSKSGRNNSGKLRDPVPAHNQLEWSRCKFTYIGYLGECRHPSSSDHSK